LQELITPQFGCSFIKADYAGVTPSEPTENFGNFGMLISQAKQSLKTVVKN